ncbi:MAG: diguanylate cyclase, partial [Armatimonadota bacterium]
GDVERLRLLESVVVNANDVILITEAEPIEAPDGPRVVYINEAFTRMTGYQPEDILGKTPRIMQGPDTDCEVRDFIRNKLKAWEGFRAELLNYRKDGSPFWVELNVQPVADANGWFTHWISIQRETTERKVLEAERERYLVETTRQAEQERTLAEALDRADRDPLTGLLNHRAFHERLLQESAAAQQEGTTLAIIVLDLDNFKFFNDSYGHLAGDEVLRQIATVLSSCGRTSDTIARLGGDEFALLLPLQKRQKRIERSECAALVARLREHLNDIGYFPPGYEIPIPLTVSCGYALYPDESSSPLTVLDIADERLRLDKVGGQDYETRQLREELKATVDGFAMLDALVTSVDNKDRYTRRHSEHVLQLSLVIADRLGLPEEDRRNLIIAALLHDVGKVGTPDRILRLPGRLPATDYEIIKQHAAMGALLVGAIPSLAAAVDGIHFHHERWDGGGYPNGLKGEGIPLPARILAVADSYSAMTMDRPYRKGMTESKVREILRGDGGCQWDPHCVQVFLEAG